jgi:hypothetical protein
MIVKNNNLNEYIFYFSKKITCDDIIKITKKLEGDKKIK